MRTSENHGKIADYRALEHFLNQSLCRLPVPELATLIKIGLGEYQIGGYRVVRNLLQLAKGAYERGNKEEFRQAVSKIQEVVESAENIFQFPDSAVQKSWEESYLRYISPEGYAKNIEELRVRLRAKLQQEIAEERRRRGLRGERNPGRIEETALFYRDNDKKIFEKLLEIEAMYSDDAETVFYLISYQAQRAFLDIFGLKSMKHWPPILLREKPQNEKSERPFVNLVDVLFQAIFYLSYTDSFRKEFADEAARASWFAKNAEIIYRASTAILTAWALKMANSPPASR